MDVNQVQNFLNNGSTELIDLQGIELQPMKQFKTEQLQQFVIYSERLKGILEYLERMKISPKVPLLITGDTGSGKELIAQFMHYEVDEAKGEYIAVNCSNMSKELFEAELFGYEKGAFTGADQKGKPGYIQQAANGTLFLDEISEIDLDIQSKLLRVLETGEYFKLGGRNKQKTQCRLIFATNKKLIDLVEKGEFREDLYYRLNIVSAEVPPLKQRREEIIPMVLFFIRQMNQEWNKKVRYIEPQVLKLLYAYKWPGNIRELKNFITQIMIFIDGDTIKFEHLRIKDELDRYTTQTKSPFVQKKIESEDDLIDLLLQKPFNLEQFIMKVIKQTLEKFRGNKAKTARFLGLKREQLYNRYKVD
ncbi:MAG: sigma 54-interacting transcriptional regulator [Bacteroidota bacterium]